MKEAKEYGNIFVSRKYNLDESMVRRWTRESTKLDSAILELKKTKASLLCKAFFYGLYSKPAKIVHLN